MALGVVGAWFVGLAVFSGFIYNRVNLSEDFGIYAQAWTRIGQGHLDPYSTVYGYSFLKGDFELVVWPLALLHILTPHPVVLLWVQDLAVAGCAFVTFQWTFDILAARNLSVRASAGIGAIVLAAFMLNPHAYGAVSFDFHLEPISTLFLVLAARDIWAGRTGRSWLWVGGLLLCGSFAAITLTGLGLSAVLAGKPSRRHGLYVIAAGLGWLGLISLLHANQGSGIDNYAYLAGRSTIAGPGGIALLAGGILSHPWRAVDQLRSRVGDIYLLLRPVGIIGVATAWGFGVPFVVMVTNSLNGNPAFIVDSFQNFAIFPFVLVGTVIALIWIARRFTLGAVAAVVIASVITLTALTYGINRTPAVVRWTANGVGAGQAAALRSALSSTPPDAEVIASMGVVGRYCSRQFCYFANPGNRRPVQSREVVFLFVPSHDPFATATDSSAGIAYVRDALHAKPLVTSDGVAAFLWLPGTGVSSVTTPKAHAIPPAP